MRLTIYKPVKFIYKDKPMYLVENYSFIGSLKAVGIINMFDFMKGASFSERKAWKNAGKIERRYSK